MSSRYDENDSFEIRADDLKLLMGVERQFVQFLSQIPGRERLDTGWRAGRNRVSSACNGRENLTGGVSDRIRSQVSRWVCTWDLT